MDPYKQLIDHFQKIVDINNTDKILLKENFILKKFKKNEILLFKGEISCHMRFICKGCIKSYYLNEEGKEQIVHIGIEDWWVNDLYSYLTKTPAKQFIEALEDGEYLYIHRDNLEKLFDQSKAIERFFRLKFQNAYIAYIDRSINSINKSAEERYTEFVQRYPEIEQRVPQYILASYLGFTKEFLSVLRKKISSNRN